MQFFLFGEFCRGAFCLNRRGSNVFDVLLSSFISVPWLTQSLVTESFILINPVQRDWF